MNPGRIWGSPADKMKVSPVRVVTKVTIKDSIAFQLWMATATGKKQKNQAASKFTRFVWFHISVLFQLLCLNVFDLSISPNLLLLWGTSPVLMEGDRHTNPTYSSFEITWWAKHAKLRKLGCFALELWNRILKSLIKVGCPISGFPILSDFLTGRKPLLLWSF